MMRAVDIVRGIRAGSLSAGEVLRATEARIERLDPQLNCFTLQTLERARRA